MVSKATGMAIHEALATPVKSTVSLVYFVMSALVKWQGRKLLDRLFPPVVIGPVIILIGLSLSGSAVNMAKDHWLLAFVSLIGYDRGDKGKRTAQEDRHAPLGDNMEDEGAHTGGEECRGGIDAYKKGYQHRSAEGYEEKLHTHDGLLGRR